MAAVRALLISAVVILAAFVGFSYWSGTAFYHVPTLQPSRAVGTSGILDDTEISSKIKAKMVLDDYVKARSISVATKNGTVTLGGVVRSVDEHDRAMTLARDTAGVSQVIDELRVETQR
jgi:osmotically-inducible protein OsmY